MPQQVVVTRVTPESSGYPSKGILPTEKILLHPPANVYQSTWEFTRDREGAGAAGAGDGVRVWGTAQGDGMLKQKQSELGYALSNSDFAKEFAEGK